MPDFTETPPFYRFYRPILWDNGESEWKYSTGATANIVRLCGEYFILTANHCMEKESDDWSIEDCRIPWRVQSEAYCKIGKGVNFLVKEDADLDAIHGDVRIHKLEGPSCEETPLEAGEFLDLISFASSPVGFPRYLSGFPRCDQDIDWENEELRGIGSSIAGSLERTSDPNIHKFISPSLKGIEANGYCGGLITCNVLGNVSLEGIWLQGGGNTEIDFVHFLSIDVLADQLSKAFGELRKQ